MTVSKKPKKKATEVTTVTLQDEVTISQVDELVRLKMLHDRTKREYEKAQKALAQSFDVSRYPKDKGIVLKTPTAELAFSKNSTESYQWRKNDFVLETVPKEVLETELKFPIAFLKKHCPKALRNKVTSRRIDSVKSSILNASSASTTLQNVVDFALKKGKKDVA